MYIYMFNKTVITNIGEIEVYYLEGGKKYEWNFLTAFYCMNAFSKNPA